MRLSIGLIIGPAMLAAVFVGCEGGSARNIATPTTDATAAGIFEPISSGVDSAALGDFGNAEERLGWRPLRAAAPYELDFFDGQIETFREIGKPRLRTRYTLPGDESGIVFLQQPEEYPSRRQGLSTDETQTIGAFVVEFWHSGDITGANFDTGSVASGSNVLGEVWGIDKSVEDLRAFISSLVIS